MKQIPTPLEVVERQFDAYNKLDLEGFLLNFSNSFKGYRMPSTEPTFVGKEQLSQFYSTERFNRPALRAELINRTVIGNKVFDHERIWGVKEDHIEMMAVFEVRDGLIQTAWFFAAE